MVHLQIITVTQKAVWERFVLSQAPQSFLQSWNWGETNRLLGKKIWRVGLDVNRKLVGVALIIKETARRGSHLVIPGGPLFDWQDDEVVSVFINYVSRLAREEKVWFVRVRPEIPDSGSAREYFSKAGFVRSHMHLHAQNTWVLDISRSLGDILAGMRKTTRYLVKKSGTIPELEIYMSNTTRDVVTLSGLQEQTVKRHNFVGFSRSAFDAEMTSFGGDNEALLFVCKYKGRPVAAAIIIFYAKVAYYHYSGSSLLFPGLPSSYFLQWAIIQEAKKRGCSLYNFWGISPTDDPKHRFYGVTVFKKGFGGRRVDWLPAFDLPLSKLYWLTRAFEYSRKKVRRL